MQGRGSVIHGVDIKPSTPSQRPGRPWFSGVGRHRRVGGPMSMSKEMGLPATVSYPGLHRGDEGQGLGPWAPSVFIVRAEEAGQSWVRGLLLGTRGGYPDPWRGFGQSAFQYPFLPQVGHRPGGGLAFRHERAHRPSLPHLKQGPGGFHSLLVNEGLELCRAVAKRWYLA